MFYYYVAYVAQKSHLFEQTVGNAESRVEQKLTNIDQINALAESMKKDFGYEKLVITNFVLLRED